MSYEIPSPSWIPAFAGMTGYAGKAAPSGAAFLVALIFSRVFVYLSDVVLTWSTARTILS